MLKVPDRVCGAGSGRQRVKAQWKPEDRERSLQTTWASDVLLCLVVIRLLFEDCFVFSLYNKSFKFLLKALPDILCFSTGLLFYIVYVL